MCQLMICCPPDVIIALFRFGNFSTNDATFKTKQERVFIIIYNYLVYVQYVTHNACKLCLVLVWHAPLNAGLCTLSKWCPYIIRFGDS